MPEGALLEECEVMPKEEFWITKPQEQTLSIVAEGGAMRGAYAAGAIYALWKEFGLRWVDIATGSSASIGSLSYFASKQLEEGIEIWRKYLSTPEFMGFERVRQRQSFLNVDYLIDEVFRKDVRLDVKKVKGSKTRIIVPVTKVKTGKAIYIDNRTHFDWFEVLRAAKALPYAYGKSVLLDDGEYYYDGGVSDPFPLDLPEVVNSERIFIVTSKEGENKMLDVCLGLKAILQKELGVETQQFARSLTNVHEKRQAQIKELENKGVVVIRPSAYIQAFDNRQTSLEKSIEIGYRDACEHRQLQDMIAKLRREREKYFAEAA
jgi:predicted patatin/cPLA2 family phospholipase